MDHSRGVLPSPEPRAPTMIVVWLVVGFECGGPKRQQMIGQWLRGLDHLYTDAPLERPRALPLCHMRPNA